MDVWIHGKVVTQGGNREALATPKANGCHTSPVGEEATSYPVGCQKMAAQKGHSDSRRKVLTWL